VRDAVECHRSAVTDGGAGCGEELFRMGDALYDLAAWFRLRIEPLRQALDLLDVKDGVPLHEGDAPGCDTRYSAGVAGQLLVFGWLASPAAGSLLLAFSGRRQLRGIEGSKLIPDQFEVCDRARQGEGREWSIYEQFAKQFCASLGLLMTASIDSTVRIEGARVFGRNRPVPPG
jgi:hypothetical protein